MFRGVRAGRDLAQVPQGTYCSDPITLPVFGIFTLPKSRSSLLMQHDWACGRPNYSCSKLLTHITAIRSAGRTRNGGCAAKPHVKSNHNSSLVQYRSGRSGHVVAAVAATYILCSGRSGRINKSGYHFLEVVGHYGHYTKNRRPLQRSLRAHYGHYRRYTT